VDFGGEHVMQQLFTKTKLRVLIADDHDDMRNCIVGSLCGEYQIVGAVANGEELVMVATCLLPDVIVSDISMPRMDGPAARKELIAQEKTIPFVFVSVHGKNIVQIIPKKQPIALVHKRELATHLVNAVEAVRAGKPYYSPFYVK
jgi:DNA-binding NarL/FixJ family response regulator